MKTTIAMATVLLMGSFAFASDEAYTISPKCVTKLTAFATTFANANKMYYGAMPSSIGKVTVDKEATTIGESGYLNVTGKYELVVVDEDENMVSDVQFKMMVASEPHCAVMKINMEGAE